MCHSLFDCNSFFRIKSKQSVKKIVKIIIVSLNVGNLSKSMLLNILRKFKFIT